MKDERPQLPILMPCLEVFMIKTCSTADVFIAHLNCLRTREKILFTELFDDAGEILKLKPDDFRQLSGRQLQLTGAQLDGFYFSAERSLKFLEQSGIKFISFNSSTYPPQLREIYDPPFGLYVRGKLPDAEKPLLAVVGTRYPSGLASEEAFRAGFECGSCGVELVSGLAKGIDSMAHIGCAASGCRTSAVLGCGPDQLYPGASAAAAEQILLSGGFIATEYNPGQPPLKYNFPQRNRIISGLARAVLVVQAPAKSGALITADYALEQGREVFVNAHCLDGHQGAGTAGLASDGAVCVRNVTEIIKDWPGVRMAGSYEIKENTGIEPGLELAMLLEQELSGITVSSSGKYYRRNADDIQSENAGYC
jgi:DNA processing protein